MHPVAVRSLILIALAGGLSAVFASLFPASPGRASDPPADRTGRSCSGARSTLWWVGDRVPQWFLRVAVVLGTLLISVLIARSATAPGVIVTACDYMWIARLRGVLLLAREPPESTWH